MFKELVDSLSPVVKSFMSYVHKYCASKDYTDINPDLYDKMISAALRVKDANRQNVDMALKHSRTRFKIENNKWTHQVFNAPPLVVLNDAVSFLEVIQSVVDGNEYDIVAKEFFEALPVEYQKISGVLQEIRAQAPKGVKFLASNINHAVATRPSSFLGFLRYAFLHDSGKAAREVEARIEVETERYEHERETAKKQHEEMNIFIRQTMELKEWPEMSAEVIAWYKNKYPKSEHPIDDDTNEGGLMARAHYALNKRKYGTFERYDNEGRLI